MLDQAGIASRNRGSERDETASIARARGFAIFKGYLIEKVAKCDPPPASAHQEGIINDEY